MALHRAYNNLCGVTRKDDVLAPRHLEPTQEGGNAGKVPDMEVMLKEFYKASGWTPSGKPSRKTLESLGLQDVARDLYGAQKKVKKIHLNPTGFPAQGPACQFSCLQK